MSHCDFKIELRLYGTLHHADRFVACLVTLLMILYVPWRAFVLRDILKERAYQTNTIERIKLYHNLHIVINE